MKSNFEGQVALVPTTDGKRVEIIRARQSDIDANKTYTHKDADAIWEKANEICEKEGLKLHNYSFLHCPIHFKQDTKTWTEEECVNRLVVADYGKPKLQRYMPNKHQAKSKKVRTAFDK
jgi:hypothetical protein